MFGGRLVLLEQMHVRYLGRGHEGRNLFGWRRLLLLAFGFSLCIAMRANWNSCYRTIAIGLLIFVNKRVVIALRAGGSRTHRYRCILFFKTRYGRGITCANSFIHAFAPYARRTERQNQVLSVRHHFSLSLSLCSFPPILDPSAIDSRRVQTDEHAALQE